MSLTHFVAAAAVVAGTLAPPASLGAQSRDTLTARLEWVPITARDHENVSGSGSVTGTLAGNRLTITGTFEGLPSPATAARLHEGVAKGARGQGQAIAELTITSAARGDLSGSVELSAEQAAAFREEKLFVQVYTDRGVEDGSTLRGWFLR